MLVGRADGLCTSWAPWCGGTLDPAECRSYILAQAADHFGFRLGCGLVERDGMSASKWLVAGAVAMASIAAACGDDFESGGGGGATTVPCNEDPWICPPPQSCWVFTDYTFQCINVGTTPIGDACTATLGSSQCAPGSACLASTGGVNGFCVSFCDPLDATRACAVGTCTSARYSRPDTGGELPPIWLCAP